MAVALNGPSADDIAWPWRRFSAAEIACPCCGALPDPMDTISMDAIAALRAAIGRPIVLNSAHRCPVHNARVGGAPMSQHKRLAFDVRLAGHDPARLLAEAERAGFSGFGFARSFLHLDMRAAFGLRPARWFYGAASRAVWKPILEGGA